MYPIRPLPTAAATLQDLADSARRYAARARSPATLKAYASDWGHFAAWSGARGVDALPADPAVVAMYVSELADAGRLRAATISRKLAAIAYKHAEKALPNPCSHPKVQEVHSGIRRTLGTATRPVEALESDDVRELVRRAGANLKGQRDRALILVGWAGALRRSELVGLDVDDVRFEERGVIITLHRSKTDQEGEGRHVAIPMGRPVRVRCRHFGPTWTPPASLPAQSSAR